MQLAKPFDMGHWAWEFIMAVDLLLVGGWGLIAGGWMTRMIAPCCGYLLPGLCIRFECQAIWLNLKQCGHWKCHKIKCKIIIFCIRLILFVMSYSYSIYQSFELGNLLFENSNNKKSTFKVIQKNILYIFVCQRDFKSTGQILFACLV